MNRISLRVPARRMLASALRVLLGGVTLTTALRGAEAPGPVAGTVRLGNGRVAGYTVHYDRNSLRDSLRLDDGLIALTSAGSLLRFEGPAVRLVRERIDTEEVACLGRGEGGSALAGLADGRVCRVDPGTLELTEVARLPDAPLWVGWAPALEKRPAGVVAVTEGSKSVERKGVIYEVPSSVVHDRATGTTRSLGPRATTFLLDRSGRLWLGADRGEWGGWVGRVDLARGTVEEREPPPGLGFGGHDYWPGVYGFRELHDGQVWAFGGTAHMGVSDAFLARVDEPRARLLARFDTFPHVDPTRERPKPVDTSRPVMPIDHVGEDGGGLLVFSYSDVFRVDPALTSWRKVATLDITYRWGRRDAVGAYPSVTAVHPPRRPGDAWLLATVGDGYVSLKGEKATSEALPGQLGASRVTTIQNTAKGTVVFEPDEELPGWRLGPTGWEVARHAPRMRPDPAVKAAGLDLSRDAELRDGDQEVHVRDAIPWAGGTLLLATLTGLRTYDPATGKLGNVDLPEPPKPATRLVRDGRGRLWLGGDGLAVVEPDTRALVALDRVPWVGRSDVFALAPDPRHDDGVIAALGARGVAFVRVGRDEP